MLKYVKYNLNLMTKQKTFQFVFALMLLISIAFPIYYVITYWGVYDYALPSADTLYIGNSAGICWKYFYLIVPFLMIGLIKNTKSFWAGRKGPSILQPLYDFIKLMKKDFVISETTSVVFRIAPVFAIATVLFASLFIPMAGGKAIITIPVGLIVFAYTLGLGKFISLILFKIICSNCFVT